MIRDICRRLFLAPMLRFRLYRYLPPRLVGYLLLSPVREQDREWAREQIKQWKEENKP